MIIKKLSILITAFALVATMGCKKAFTPPVTSQNLNYLVVEGVVNNNGGPTTIKLSRTVKINAAGGVKPETNAVVTVQYSIGNAPGGNTILLSEQSPGVYTNPSTNLSNSQSVSLKIVTKDGRTYQSDAIPVKDSPPIDTLGYDIQSNGLQIYSSTHDATNNTRYYRWDYHETWIIHSEYASLDELSTTIRDSIVVRPSSDQIFICWQTDSSSTIVLNSTEKLSQDFINKNPITLIDPGSEKLLHEYSIIVDQFALTKSAFDYWQNIKKNTEQLGSIFDAQPSEIQGNIHSTDNPSEPVIGYVSAGGVSQKRIFIGGSELPTSWSLKETANLPAAYFQCPIDTFLYKPKPPNMNYVSLLYTGFEIPIYPIGFPVIVGYQAAPQSCVDCRIRGTNIQPAFWITKL